MRVSNDVPREASAGSKLLPCQQLECALSRFSHLLVVFSITLERNEMMEEDSSQQQQQEVSFSSAFAITFLYAVAKLN